MSSRDPSLEAKTAFFRELEELNVPSASESEPGNSDDSDCDVEPRFQPWKGPRWPSSHAPDPSTSYSLASAPTLVSTPRRTASNPLPQRNGTENDGNTQQRSVSEMMGRAELSRPAKGKTTDINPNNAESSSRQTQPQPQQLQPHRTPKRTSSTPNPLTRQLFPHRQQPGRNTRQDTPSFSSSSSLAKKPKRKRDQAEVKPVPTSKQLFQGLNFYFIPNDDIGPARNLRIRKAREYGALWTRDLEIADYVVVDRDLSWRHIRDVLESLGEEKMRSLVLVNEMYPLDCIQFRNLLNPDQKQYQIPGRPSVSAKGSGGEATTLEQGAADEQSFDVSSNSPKEDKQSKSPRLGAGDNNDDDHQMEGIPAEDTSLVLGEDGPVEASAFAGVSQTDADISKQDIMMNKSANPVEHEGLPLAGQQSIDELADCISTMQQFKDLPIEHDSDDDNASKADVSEAETNDSDADSGSGSEAEHIHKKQRTTTASKPTSRKAIAFEEKFACNTGGTQGRSADNPNARTIEILQRMCDYYARINDTWRPIAYRKAMTRLKAQTKRISTAEEAIQLPGIGKRLADKIEEICNTDRLQRLENAEKEPMDEVLQKFLRIYGVGTSQATKWIAQGYRTLEDLKEHAKLSVNQRVGIDHFDDLNERIPRKEVEALGEFVKKAAAEIDPELDLIIGGSYRRGSQSSGDIDFIVTKKGTVSVIEVLPALRRLVRVLERRGFLVAALASFTSSTIAPSSAPPSSTSSPMKDHAGSKWHGCCILPPVPGLNDTPENPYRPIWRRIDFLAVPDAEMGAALIYFTGNDIFNRSMRLLASRKGMRLNQRGLYRDVMRGPRKGSGGRARMVAGQLAEGRDEKRIFEILGVEWREPWQRWC